MLNIAFVTTCYHPVINGVVSMIELYRKELTALGHSVTVITFGRAHPQDGDHTVRIPAVPLGKTGYYFRPRFPKKIIAQLNRMNVVHCHHLFMGPELLAGKIRPPIVYTNHTRYDLYTEIYLPFKSKQVAQKAIKWLWPRNTAGCAAVIAPSRNVAEVMQSFGVTAPIQVIYNGIRLTDFKHEEADPAKNSVTGVYVGRLVAEKNVPVLIDWLIEACQQNSRLRFRLIGRGELFDECQNLIDQNRLTEQILLDGWVAHSDMPAVLAQADFQVTTSISEVHPLGIIEGMAAGLPGVVLADPAMAECVGKGAIVAQNRAEWLDGVHKLAQSADLRAELGAKALAQAQAYDICKTVAETVELYERVAVG